MTGLERFLKMDAAIHAGARLDQPGDRGWSDGVRLEKISQRLERSVRQAQRLFHMAVGIAFLALAAVGAFVSFSEWQFHGRVPSTGLVRFAMYAGFTVFLTILGLYSFLRARSVR